MKRAGWVSFICYGVLCFKSQWFSRVRILRVSKEFELREIQQLYMD